MNVLPGLRGAFGSEVFELEPVRLELVNFYDYPGEELAISFVLLNFFAGKAGLFADFVGDLGDFECFGNGHTPIDALYIGIVDVHGGIDVSGAVRAALAKLQRLLPW